MGKRTLPEPGRGKSYREPKRRFFVFCEGRNTEPDYFNAIRLRFGGAIVQVEVVKAAGVPSTIAKKTVDKAKELGLLKGGRQRKNSFEQQDQVWAVFDRDEHPDYADAVQKCQSNGIRVGRSNPCFELWLILHDQDFHRPDDRHAVQRHLSSVCPDYDPGKGKTLDSHVLMDRVEAAEVRAETQLACRAEEGNPFGVPSTTVGHLTREIREAAAGAAMAGRS